MAGKGIYYACIDDTWLDILMHSRDSILGRPTKAFDAATKAMLIPRYQESDRI